jgi:hypothetical protein
VHVIDLNSWYYAYGHGYVKLDQRKFTAVKEAERRDGSTLVLWRATYANLVGHLHFRTLYGFFIMLQVKLKK